MSKSDRLRTFQDLSALTHAAAELFAELSKNAIQNSGRFTVALSGGSTPIPLYTILADAPYREMLDWPHTFFFWGDERFVPADHPESNYRNAVEALLSKIPVAPQNVFPVKTENRTPHDAAVDYENTLRDFFGQSLPCFDLILLGMGEDGHTASLFPYTGALKESQRWVVENYVKSLNADRITLTLPVINNAANVLFLVAEERKQEALNVVLNGPFEPMRYPAQLVEPRNGNLDFFVTASTQRR